MADAPPFSLLGVAPLVTAAFAPYGEVIEAGAAARRFVINDGTAERFDDLARLVLTAQGGRPLLSLFRARPRALPLPLRQLERHRLGSQAFVPLGAARFLVVVAAPGPAPTRETVRGFVAAPGQGLNFAPGTWHHPLIAIGNEGRCSDFLVIDRGTPGGEVDCDEVDIGPLGLWLGDPEAPA